MDNDLDATRRGSPHPARRAQLKQWLDEARPDYWGANLTGAGIKVNTEVLYQDPRTGKACVVASLRRVPGQRRESHPHQLQPPTQRQPRERPSTLRSSTGGIEMLLYWVLDSSGQWLLDVERLLEKLDRFMKKQ